MDLIRELMLGLEAVPLRTRVTLHVKPDEPEAAVPGYDTDAIAYHLTLIRGARFIKEANFRAMHGIGFSGFTSEGHDFIDSVRDPESWQKTEGALKEAGGLSLDLAKASAKGFIKKKIEQHTGAPHEL